MKEEKWKRSWIYGKDVMVVKVEEEKERERKSRRKRKWKREEIGKKK